MSKIGTQQSSVCYNLNLYKTNKYVNNKKYKMAYRSSTYTQMKDNDTNNDLSTTTH